MINKIYFLLSIPFYLGAITESNFENQTIKNLVLKTERTPNGSVPKDKKIYEVMRNREVYTLTDMIRLYEEDVKETMPDYETNLKNMWFLELNPKLIKSGTEKQKRQYAVIQNELSQNLPNIKGFYELLLSVEKWHRADEVYVLAADFSKKNQSFIEKLEWKNEERKKSKTQELHYQSALFYKLVSGKK
jgi:hypothetical protein